MKGAGRKGKKEGRWTMDEGRLTPVRRYCHKISLRLVWRYREIQMKLDRKTAYAIFAVVVALVLYTSSLYGYLLFHSIAELFSIFIAVGIFVVAWNTKNFSPNTYLLFLGIAYLHRPSCSSIKFNAEDYGRKPVGESVPAAGWKY